METTTAQPAVLPVCCRWCRLNRDTWAQDLVQDMLRGTFVFWQVTVEQQSFARQGVLLCVG